METKNELRREKTRKLEEIGDVSAPMDHGLGLGQMIPIQPTPRLKTLIMPVERRDNIIGCRLNLPIGGRLKCFKPQWASLGDILNRTAMELIGYDGITLKPKYLPAHEVEHQGRINQATNNAIIDAIARGIVEKCPNTGERLVSLPVWGKMKPNGKTRLLMNGKPLTEPLSESIDHTKFITIQKVASLINEGEYLTKLDLKDGYFLVPLERRSRHLVTFTWKGENWQFAALPQGVATAPGTFTKLLDNAGKVLASWKIKHGRYIDDIIIWGTNPRTLERNTWRTINLLSNLGFIFDANKIVTKPTKNIDWLGYTLDTRTMKITLPKEKLKALRTQFSREYTKAKDKTPFSMRQLARMIGVRQEIGKAVRNATAKVRWLTVEKNIRQKEGDSWETKRPLSEKAMGELRWWNAEWEKKIGVDMHPKSRADYIVITDASLDGWGIIIKDADGKILYTAEGQWQQAQTWSAKSINALEIRTTALAFIELQKIAKRGSRIEIQTDNMANVAAWRRPGSLRPHHLDMQNKALKTIVNMDYAIAVRYIPTDIIEADVLTRRDRDTTDWKLHTRLYRIGDQRWGPHEVDGMASLNNRQCKKFISLKPQPGAIGMDLFSLNLRCLGNIWVNPPYIDALIARLLQKIAEERPKITLCLPHWTYKAWWTALEHMPTEIIILPRQKDMFVPATRFTRVKVGPPSFDVALVRFTYY